MRIFPKPLRQRGFVYPWLSNGFSWQGLWMEVLVLGWLALELANAPWKVALVGFARAMPFLPGAFTSVSRPVHDIFCRMVQAPVNAASRSSTSSPAWVPSDSPGSGGT